MDYIKFNMWLLPERGDQRLIPTAGRHFISKRLYFSERKEKKTMREEWAHANVNDNLRMITVINGKRLSHHCC